jgi:hypothetical protein
MNTGAGGASGMDGGGGGQPLSVQLIGNGQGTVSSSPPGINCSNAGTSGPCSANFPRGTSITLTSTAAGNAMFSGWSGGGCNGNGSCTVTLDTPQSVTATFLLAIGLNVTVAGDGQGSVTSDPAGITCTSGSTQGCSYGFPDSIGNQVRLTVYPSAASTFAGWSFGGCNGSGYTHTCPVALNTNPSGNNVTVWFSAWQARQPFPSAADAATLFDGTYIVVGHGGAAVTSPDGTGNWTGHVLPSQDAFRGITTSGTMAVAVGDRGSILTTSDESTWTAATSGTTSQLNGIAFGAGKFAAVGNAGTIVTSSDAVTFTPVTPLTNYDLLAITYGGGQFTAVGYGGTILTSTDGTSWTSRTSPTTQFLSGVTWGASQFVAVGSAGAIVTSPDGAAWTSRTAFTSSTLRSVVATSGSPAYIAAGDAVSNMGSAAIFTSDDAVTWAAHDTGAYQEQFGGLAYLGGKLLALGTGGSIYRSSVGIDWTPSLPPGGRGPIGTHDGTSIGAMAFGGGTYVAAGNYGSVLTSPDGITWTSRAADRVGVTNTALAYGNNAFVMTQNAGSACRILSSSDGSTWNERAPSTSCYLAGAAYGDPSKGFVAIGSESGGGTTRGLAFTSADGVSWTKQAGAPTVALSSIAYGNQLFAATAGSGALYTSPDGVTFTPQASPTADLLGALIYGNGVFVALDLQNGGRTVVTSTNGISWTKSDLSFSLGGALTFADGHFLSSALATSSDGVSWTQPTGVPENIPLINGGIFTAAAHGPAGWVGGGLFETLAFHP